MLSKHIVSITKNSVGLLVCRLIHSIRLSTRWCLRSPKSKTIIEYLIAGAICCWYHTLYFRTILNNFIFRVKRCSEQSICTRMLPTYFLTTEGKAIYDCYLNYYLKCYVFLFLFRYIHRLNNIIKSMDISLKFCRYHWVEQVIMSIENILPVCYWHCQK